MAVAALCVAPLFIALPLVRVLHVRESERQLVAHSAVVRYSTISEHHCRLQINF